MNGDTVALIRRPYADLVDDILTSVVGGVVNEPIRFDNKIFTYPLAEPAAGIRGATGTASGRPRTFLAEIDFVFGPATNVIIWLDAGTRPDDDTTFFVDYFRAESRSPLTDINVGSVTRTLCEAIGREIVTVYEQINLAYLSAFVDTARGRSLDYVVSILDVTRKTAEFAEGLVTLFRSGGVEGNITIPEGTRFMTAVGGVVFTSSQPRTLQRGQVRIDVPVRAGDGFAGDAGLVAAGAISEMSQPVAGIERVTNLDPTIKAAADETDDELRARAKAALRALGKATIAALDLAIREGRGRPVEFFDPNGPPEKRSAPGSVTIVVDAEPERLPSLYTVVHETRAAGVLATLVARYVYVTPRLSVTITPGISRPGKDQVKADIVAAMRSYVDGLKAGDAADGAALLAAALAVEDVTSAKIVDVVVTRADLSALATPGSRAPGGGRIPDRGLLRSTAEGRAGQPATDAEIEAATFEVSASVGDADWWIALEMSPADIGGAEDGGA